MTDTLDEVFRREAGRCTATLIRVLGDIDLAEDAVAEAFAIAAEQWPKTGIPPNPGGWITTTARNRAIDRLRRESTRSERHLEAHRLHTDSMDPDHDPELGRLDDFVDVVPDDQLRLMFLCAHPALAADAQVALILRLLASLETKEIAKAFLVPEATMAQRIVRAKRKLHDNHASYRIPRAAELPDRLHAVLTAIYLIYTEGHTATSGQSLTRTDLSTEAVRLGRTLIELMPDEPEAIGLARPDAAHRVPPSCPQQQLRDHGAPRRPGPLSLGPDTDHRRPRARARLPSPQPARTVPDPGSDSRGARRRPHRRSH